MPNLHLEYLFEDDEQLDPTALPDYTTLDFVSNGSHIYGEIMWPSENYPKPHPCVIMLHGFPGLPAMMIFLMLFAELVV